MVLARSEATLKTLIETEVNFSKVCNQTNSAVSKLSSSKRVAVSQVLSVFEEARNEVYYREIIKEQMLKKIRLINELHERGSSGRGGGQRYWRRWANGYLTIGRTKPTLNSQRFIRRGKTTLFSFQPCIYYKKSKTLSKTETYKVSKR